MNSVERFVRDCALTFLKKNKDYGDSFKQSLDEFGVPAFKVRAFDKIKRIEALLENEDREVKDETLKDTVLDLFIYTCMACAWEKNPEMLLSHIVYILNDYTKNPTDALNYLSNHSLEVQEISQTYLKIVRSIADGG